MIIIINSRLWGRWVGDHAKKDLAKFGYRLKEECKIHNTNWYKFCSGPIVPVSYGYWIFGDTYIYQDPTGIKQKF
jgi:hypothetical protein